MSQRRHMDESTEAPQPEVTRRGQELYERVPPYMHTWSMKHFLEYCESHKLDVNSCKKLKRVRRMINNRQSADLSRQRKRDYVESLEATMEETRDELKRCKTELEAAQSAKREEEKCTDARVELLILEFEDYKKRSDEDIKIRDERIKNLEEIVVDKDRQVLDMEEELLWQEVYYTQLRDERDDLAGSLEEAKKQIAQTPTPKRRDHHARFL
jgi:chromosome segregation ATPase